ncbi:MAG TPA: metallophosphoesterase [Candidatus Hydrogenedentes bacterium]|nr:metallophosphoesterase [Candidatus Hydrogenedentota bacterium]HPG66141.1 metallophosphoesterase [Candidatus Hydrogenedentota bacterium]
MQLSRRQFIGLVAAFGAGARARAVDLPFGLGRKDGFTFAAINDLHVLDAPSTAIVNRAVASINGNPEIAFTVVLGDLATAGKLVELGLARKSLDRLDRPCFVVPGNHDVETRSKDILGSYEKSFGDGCWSQKDRGWVFLGLDSCEGAASDVSVQPKRMDWLKKQVKRIDRDRPIALFAHHPFNPHSKAYRVKNADEVLGLFKDHCLRLVATGHWHGNQVEEQNGVLFTTTACCSSTRDNFDKTPEKGYRLFRVAEGTVTTEFVVVV